MRSPTGHQGQAPGVEEREDMWMLQFREHAHFPQEAISHAREGEFGSQHFHRDGSTMPDIGRNPDARHAALAELSFEGISITEFSFNYVAEVGHTALLGGSKREYLAEPRPARSTWQHQHPRLGDGGGSKVAKRGSLRRASMPGSHRRCKGSAGRAAIRSVGASRTPGRGPQRRPTPRRDTRPCAR